MILIACAITQSGVYTSNLLAPDADVSDLPHRDDCLCYLHGEEQCPLLMTCSKGKERLSVARNNVPEASTYLS